MDAARYLTVNTGKCYAMHCMPAFLLAYGVLFRVRIRMRLVVPLRAGTRFGDGEAMIRLRLRRMGRKGQPHYRIVAAEARWPRDGRFIEEIGYYNPRTEPATIQVNAERAQYWLSHGAQPTETVRSILVKAGVLPGRNGAGQGTTTQANA
jgi:small subunit ribosomal protein S16